MFWNKKKQTELKIDEAYKGLRNQALNILPTDLSIILDEGKNQVYAAVIDMPVNERIVTLVCMFDGTTSLYFSNGGGVLGAGQKHEIVRKASGDFLFSAGQAVPSMQAATEYPLPTGKESKIYLKCGDGTFATQINMGEKQSEKYKIFLNFLIQRIVSAFHESGEI